MATFAWLFYLPANLVKWHGGCGTEWRQQLMGQKRRMQGKMNVIQKQMPVNIDKTAVKTQENMSKEYRNYWVKVGISETKSYEETEMCEVKQEQR